MAISNAHHTRAFMDLMVPETKQLISTLCKKYHAMLVTSMRRMKPCLNIHKLTLVVITFLYYFTFTVTIPAKFPRISRQKVPQSHARNCIKKTMLSVKWCLMHTRTDSFRQQMLKCVGKL
jgi:hypothetical protein